MLTQYDALIPMEDMKGSFKLIHHMCPTVFTNTSGMKCHAQASNESNKKDGVEGRGTRILESVAERGGFLLTYQVACAKFRLEMDRNMFHRKFCEEFIGSSGVADGQESAVVSPASNNRYLLCTSVVKGGLHNQIMILTHLGKLDSKLSRTLIVLQLIHGHPKSSSYLEMNIEMDDIYDVAYLHQNGFPYDLISLNMVPPGLFLGNIETVDLDKNLRPPTSNDMKEEARKMLEKHSGNHLLVVKRDHSQMFSNMKISRIYSSFRLSDKLSLVLEDCLIFIFDIHAGKPLVSHGGGVYFGVIDLSAWTCWKGLGDLGKKEIASHWILYVHFRN